MRSADDGLDDSFRLRALATPIIAPVNAPRGSCPVSQKNRALAVDGQAVRTQKDAVKMLVSVQPASTCGSSAPIGKRLFICASLAATDPRFPKYPTLPVITCLGYEPKQREAPAQ